MNFTIKNFNELSIKELYDILKLRNEVFVVEQNCIYQDCDDKDFDSYHLFSSDENKVSSYIRIIDSEPTNPEVIMGRLVVSPGFRNSGLARKNLTKAIDFVKNELSKKLVRISAQEYLLDFYTSVGFKKISEVYLEDNIPHIAMILEL